MKKIIILTILSMLLCGCAKQIDEYPIDARYTEAYQGIVTTYEYELDIFSEEGFKKMPNTHSKMFPAKYELQYRIKYDDGTSKTEWRTVARDEYEAFMKGDE